MATAIDAAQVTYEAPDLDLMEQFLTAFGMTKVEGSDENVLYMRGTGPQHHIHVTRKAPKQRFVGASIEVATLADLEELAAKPGSSPVQPSTEPGGGHEVVMTMPDGFELKAVWGRTKHDPLPDRAPATIPGRLFTETNSPDRQQPSLEQHSTS